MPASLDASNRSLPAGWAYHSGDESSGGRPFYYNTSTGDSQWDPPVLATSVKAKEVPAVLPAGWQLVPGQPTKGGGMSPNFYYNESTGESRYYRPFQVTQELASRASKRAAQASKLAANTSDDTLGQHEWRSQFWSWIGSKAGEWLSDEETKQFHEGVVHMNRLLAERYTSRDMSSTKTEWFEATDPASGKPYWYSADGETSWENPDNTASKDDGKKSKDGKKLMKKGGKAAATFFTTAAAAFAADRDAAKDVERMIAEVPSEDGVGPNTGTKIAGFLGRGVGAVGRITLKTLQPGVHTMIVKPIAKTAIGVAHVANEVEKLKKQQEEDAAKGIAPEKGAKTKLFQEVAMKQIKRDVRKGVTSAVLGELGDLPDVIEETQGLAEELAEAGGEIKGIGAGAIKEIAEATTELGNLDMCDPADFDPLSSADSLLNEDFGVDDGGAGNEPDGTCAEGSGAGQEGNEVAGNDPDGKCAEGSGAGQEGIGGDCDHDNDDGNNSEGDEDGQQDDEHQMSERKMLRLLKKFLAPGKKTGKRSKRKSAIAMSEFMGLLSTFAGDDDDDDDNEDDDNDAENSNADDNPVEQDTSNSPFDDFLKNEAKSFVGKLLKPDQNPKKSPTEKPSNQNSRNPGIAAFTAFLKELLKEYLLEVTRNSLSEEGNDDNDKHNDCSVGKNDSDPQGAAIQMTMSFIQSQMGSLSGKEKQPRPTGKKRVSSAKGNSKGTVKPASASKNASPRTVASSPSPKEANSTTMKSESSPVPQQTANTHTLPPNWATKVDTASGKTFYYHTGTGESSWEPPKAADTFATQPVVLPPPPAVSDQLPPNWATQVDPATGKIFYYHTITGESRWEPPQRVTAVRL